MSFANNLAALLSLRGLTQAALARTLRVTRPAVGQWLAGETTPTGKRLEQIAKALGVTVPQLFSPADNFTKPVSLRSGSQLVDDPDELALLMHWRSLNQKERALMSNLLRSGARPRRKRT